MQRTLSLLAAAAFTLSLAGVASAAPTLDAKGKCRDGGRFVAASMCATPAPAANAAAGGMTGGAHPKKCVKGKPCGNTCISVKDVCHK